MKNYPSLLRFFPVFVVLLSALTACGGSGAKETLEVVLPQATPTPIPFQDLFATPTADLFQFLLDTPTSTPPPPQVQVILPQTGADRAERPVFPKQIASAGLVIFGLLLVSFGVLRRRR